MTRFGRRKLLLGAAAITGSAVAAMGMKAPGMALPLGGDAGTLADANSTGHAVGTIAPASGIAWATDNGPETLYLAGGDSLTPLADVPGLDPEQWAMVCITGKFGHSPQPITIMPRDTVRIQFDVTVDGWMDGTAPLGSVVVNADTGGVRHGWADETLGRYLAGLELGRVAIKQGAETYVWVVGYNGTLTPLADWTRAFSDSET